MFVHRRVGRNDGDLAGHAQVNQQRDIFRGGGVSATTRARWLQIHKQIFAQTADLHDGGAGKIEFQRGGIVDEIGLTQTHAKNASPGQSGAHSTRDGFYFGKFRHASILLRSTVGAKNAETN